jgi:hypothetical protein
VNPTIVRGRIIASLFYSRCLRELRMFPSPRHYRSTGTTVHDLIGQVRRPTIGLL